MKKYLVVITLIFTFAAGALTSAYAQDMNAKRKEIIDSLTTIDPDIRQYFPRWKVCEKDLQIQLYRSFLYQGYEEKMLSKSNITVLAAPKEFVDQPFTILMITCGEASMNAVEIESMLGDILVGMLAGDYIYGGIDHGTFAEIPKRSYCYEDIPREVPMTSSEADAIINYLEPTNVSHAFTLSLFEQAIKIGETGFWLRSKMGIDEIGYPFWTGGEAKIVLQRPLYINEDSETNDRIPYLINAFLGGGYRITTGINNENNLLSWVTDRKLNTGPGGKLIAGFDFHMPFHPQAGLQFNLEVPLRSLQQEGIEPNTYAFYQADADVDFAPTDPRYGAYRIDQIAPLLRQSGQISLFYNWWMSDKDPENYLRADLGITYFEVRELGFYVDTDGVPIIEPYGIEGLNTYKPNEAGDWVFAKLEYRNQAAFPFGASVQYSNQILLGRVYIPLFGNWFYIEGKYATPLRGARPYEAEDFFMISPVIRLTI
ncbi:MAG: hypothetical protein ACLFQX_05050 [Candidatus Kapaibacterium sp.]